ncbi:MAG: hypothetical protein ONB13_03655 [candidate division KSB1 bacterium]|nr:hypothetical protein [candidate division KSB1 bacterium]
MKKQATAGKEELFAHFKSKLIRLFSHKKLIIVLSILLSLFIIEISFDFVEIMLGTAVELTNPYRPRSGTIWELYRKDRLANEQIKQIIATLPDESPPVPQINTLPQLKNWLEIHGSVFLSADQFVELYSQFPPNLAGEMVSPFDLLKLSHSRKWVWTKIVTSDSSLRFYFLDGDKQLLLDSYPSMALLLAIADSSQIASPGLDLMEQFTGRTITREQFFAAFDDLPTSIKLQLINNPFQLVKWDKNIQKVAIARHANGNVVPLGIQVRQGIYSEVHIFEASELAVELLIENLNRLYPELHYIYPEERYEASAEHF